MIEAQLDPDDQEEVKSLKEYLDEQHEKAVKSYEGYDKDLWPLRWCTRCGRLMIRNSMAYNEGWHFDSCY